MFVHIGSGGHMAVPVEQAVERAVERAPVEDLGTKTSLAVHRAVLKSGEGVRDTVDLLHGTWLGHPLHPVLTEVTIGAWFIGGACDAVGAIGRSRRSRLMGDRLAEIGTACAIPTALTGLADFSTFPKWSAKPATLHAALNVVNVGLYATSLWQRRRGNRSRGLALSFAAQALTLASAWLGGMLVYKHKVGVDHSERFTGPRDWTPVLHEGDLIEGRARRVEVEGKQVLLAREEGRVYAIGAVCSHAGGPLDQGKIRDGCVQCPWHDSVFALRDGRVVHGPATQPQASFETRVRSGRIEIRLARRQASG
jgi:nitrite reductase/ring-hydroxylating ferredoxin subunit/uncharacterized membrane protein